MDISLIKSYRLWRLDHLWQTPSTSSLSGLSPSGHHPDLALYTKALIADVLNDRPLLAMQLLLTSGLLHLRFVRSRLVYLACRCHKPKIAARYLSAWPASSRSVLLRCLQQMPSAFTPTPTLMNITSLYGINPHFGRLESLVRRYHLKTGVEVGVYQGFHACHLLEACRNLHLYGVDIYKVNGDNGYQDYDNHTFETLYHRVQKNFRPFGRAEIIRDFSSQAARHHPWPKLDFVYLDADHRRPAVAMDLKVWTPLIRKGGIIAGHDYGHPSWPGVKQAVDWWINKTGRRLHYFSDTFWWIQK